MNEYDDDWNLVRVKTAKAGKTVRQVCGGRPMKDWLLGAAATLEGVSIT